VSQAAVELSVSQSAVAAAIQQLEIILGLKLFDRNPTGVSMTAGGSRFLQHARNITAAVTDAMQVPRASPQLIRGPVRVGVTYTVAGYFLPRHHDRFRRNYPHVDVELFESPRPPIEHGLIEGLLSVPSMDASRAPIAEDSLGWPRRRCSLYLRDADCRRGDRYSGAILGANIEQT
jgi:DNA-binding transcriptional LysR family regulator